MQTDELIDHLTAALEPVKRGAVARILLGAMVIGLLASIALMLGVLGPRHHLADAMTGPAMAMKLVYTLAIAALALRIVERAGRPGARIQRPLVLLALPLAAMTAIAALAMTAPGADTRLLVMGQSSRVCSVLVVMVALPVLAATFWALRRLAPTRPALAGAGAGLFAGAAGAFVYAFHCTEDAAPFVALWYSLGIALTALIGALLGRFALRW